MENRFKDSFTLRDLEDAGCGADIIERFVCLEKDKKTKEQLRMLTRHRHRLLDNAHKAQKELDCLDYIVRLLKKEDSAAEYREKQPEKNL